MKRSRFTENQTIGILNEHDTGVSVADLCRKHCVSDATIYKWTAKYCGMDVSEAKRLKGVEHVNYSPIFGQFQGWVKLLPAAADWFRCC